MFYIPISYVTVTVKIFCIILYLTCQVILLLIVNQSLYVKQMIHIYSQINMYLCIKYKTITMKLLLTESIKILLWCLTFLLIIMLNTKYVHKTSPITHEHKHVRLETGLDCYF